MYEIPDIAETLNEMRQLTGALLLAAVPALAANVERSLPTFFIPNSGILDPSIRYFVNTPELRAAFTPSAAVFQIHEEPLHLRFAGASALQIEGVKPLPGRANFLSGDVPENWRTGLPTYGGILYRNLYPGIDMTYAAAGHRIKSEFRVAAGADPSRIRLEYSANLSIAEKGDLLIRGKSAEMREEAPVIYQRYFPGESLPVEGRYRLLDAHTAGFEIGAYDASLPLVIDPTISYTTYLGGTCMRA